MMEMNVACLLVPWDRMRPRREGDGRRAPAGKSQRKAPPYACTR